MCFSATASFIAGASLSAAGAATIKKARKKSDIPFAAIPLIFGIQQLVEGFVWLSFSWHVPFWNSIFSNIFFFFSNVWWPIFVPISVLLIEPIVARKKILSVFAFAGAVVSLYYLNFMMEFPVVSKVVNECIVYAQPQENLNIFAILYVVVTCASCLFSSVRFIKALGVLVFLSFLVAGFYYSWALVSVWCFFAAIISLLIYTYFR